MSLALNVAVRITSQSLMTDMLIALDAITNTNHQKKKNQDQ